MARPRFYQRGNALVLMCGCFVVKICGCVPHVRDADEKDMADESNNPPPVSPSLSAVAHAWADEKAMAIKKSYCRRR